MSRRPSSPTATTVAQPAGRTITALHKQARSCTACPLYKNATQTVFGEGPVRARLMLVGETPGNDEDLAGRPFVGPAGRLLDRCLEAAGIDRDAAYVTNMVKHFKWERRGKRRLHQRPSPGEIRACRPWLDAEIALVKPKVLVCLGATATQALLGADQRVTRIRGRPMESDLAPFVIATVHPSALLRAYDDAREAEIKRFVADLRVAAVKLRSSL
jgi:uracil-DNA glycosylase family protein